MQCLALPFIRKGTEQPFLECVLLLPKKDLSTLEDKLSPQNFDTWLKKSTQTVVDAKIPKFCFSKKLLLNTPLKELGIVDAFGFQADFEKIDGMKDLYLNKVLHETFFSFHEEGVTAASATSSYIGIKSPPPPSENAIPFVADHPFLFFIVDVHSGAILFMGRVSNPQQDQCDES